MGSKNFDFDAFVKEAGEQLRSGKSLIGAEGIFTPLLKRVIEASLEGELDQHLKETKKGGSNRRNGHTQKIFKARWAALIFFPPATGNHLLNHKR
jgi:transposase-like protein